MKRTALILAASTLCACVSTSQIIEIGPNAFTVSATADGMRSAASARESAFTQAAGKCRALGKQINVTSENSERTRMGIDTTYSVNFRCE